MNASLVMKLASVDLRMCKMKLEQYWDQRRATVGRNGTSPVQYNNGEYAEPIHGGRSRWQDPGLPRTISRYDRDGSQDNPGLLRTVGACEARAHVA